MAQNASEHTRTRRRRWSGALAKGPISLETERVVSAYIVQPCGQAAAARLPLREEEPLVLRTERRSRSSCSRLFAVFFRAYEGVTAKLAKMKHVRDGHSCRTRLTIMASAAGACEDAPIM